MKRCLLAVLGITILMVVSLSIAAPTDKGAPVPAVITAGVGLKDLKVGMPVANVTAIYGIPDPPLPADRTMKPGEFSISGRGVAQVDPSDWLVYKSHGIAVVPNKAGKIALISFRYRGKTYASFDGATEKGIGMLSTVADVLRAYGKPAETSDAYTYEQHVSSYGHVFERTLFYDNPPMTIGFRNGELQYLAVGQSPQ